jgi:hypothetical protein
MMPTQLRKRAMTSKEREFLHGISYGGLSRSAFFFLNFGVPIASWGFVWGVLILCWLVVAWLARVTVGEKIGWHSAAASWVIPLSGLAAAAYMFSIFLFVGRSSKKDSDTSLKTDLEAGQVVEEDYKLTAAKRMQEQEHGGLIYFLRTVDDDVLVLYDEESQQLGVLDDEPLNSSFQPCSNLIMIRAPKTGYVIDKIFSGELLDAGEPLDLLASPDDWPENEEFCDIAWDDLEATYCR